MAHDSLRAVPVEQDNLILCDEALGKRRGEGIERRSFPVDPEDLHVISLLTDKGQETLHQDKVREFPVLIQPHAVVKNRKDPKILRLPKDLNQIRIGTCKAHLSPVRGPERLTDQSKDLLLCRRCLCPFFLRSDGHLKAADLPKARIYGVPEDRDTVRAHQVPSLVLLQMKHTRELFHLLCACLRPGPPKDPRKGRVVQPHLPCSLVDVSPVLLHEIP